MVKIESEKFGFSVNTKQNKFKKKRGKCNLEGKRVEQVTSFQYFAFFVVEGGRCEKKILRIRVRRRIGILQIIISHENVYSVPCSDMAGLPD